MPRPELIFNITILIPGLVGVVWSGGMGYYKWNKLRHELMKLLKPGDEYMSIYYTSSSISDYVWNFHYKKDKNKNKLKISAVSSFVLLIIASSDALFLKKKQLWFDLIQVLFFTS